MRNKVFTALLLAGALVLSPISGSLTGFNVSAETGDTSVSPPDSGEGDPAEEDQSLEDFIWDYDVMPEDPNNPTAEESAAASEALTAILERAASEAEANSVTLAELFTEDSIMEALMSFERGYRRAKGFAPTFRITDEKVWSKEEANWAEAPGSVENLADDAENAVLKMEAAGADPSDKSAYASYGAYYLVNISLEGVIDAKNLRCPVRVAIPVPSGLDAEGDIVLYHYANGIDSAPVKINAKIVDGQGAMQGENGEPVTVTMKKIFFVLTSFGDSQVFAIAGTPATVSKDDAAAEVTGKLEGLTSTLENGNVAELENVVSETLTNAGMDELEAVLAEDEKVIEDLEKAYLEKKGLQETAVSAESSALPEDAESKISVVGAGLNELDDNETKATLKLEDSAEKPAEAAQYAKSVALDITLEGVKDTKNLRCPVKITLPIPRGMNTGKTLVVLHYAAGPDKAPTTLKVTIDPENGTMSFCVSSFSVFVIAEGEEAQTPDVPKEDDNSGSKPNGGSDDDDDDNDSAGASAFTVDVENQIMSAAGGATVKLTGITALSNGMMKALLAKKDVTLVMEYAYEGKNYTVVIPAGAAVDNGIPWYGPLYLAGHYGNSGSYVAGSGTSYVVKSGDTMSKIAKVNRMTLAQLAAKNPQIKNINLILVGQKINL